MKLTHPCKDTCSGYSQDCAEQIESLQARAKSLEEQLKTCRDGRDAAFDLFNSKIEALQKLVDAAKSYFLTRDLEAAAILGQEFLK